MDRLRGHVELTRPLNTLAAGLLAFIGAFVADGVTAPQAVAAAVGATVLATGAGNAINDYFDREIDRRNRPGRPIPRGAVSPRGALVLAGVCFLGAIALAVTLPPIAIAIAVVNLLALLAYTELFKGLPGVGNLVVAYLTGSAFLFGGAAVGHPWGAATLAMLAGLATLAREIVKDIEDVPGDRAEGLRTLPIVLGARPALVLAALALALAVLASPVPYLLGTFGVGYLLVVVPADCVMLAAIWRARVDAGTGQRWLKVGMYLAAVAFVVGRAVVLVGGGAPIVG
jgi:geranylgeranylglycerol-phosphate geranylgeranyltransferase